MAEDHLSPSPLTAFCDFMSSPNWLYPTTRFFGHALYGNLTIYIATELAIWQLSISYRHIAI